MQSSWRPFYTFKCWALDVWQISVYEFQFSALFVHKNVLYSFLKNPIAIILNRKKKQFTKFLSQWEYNYVKIIYAYGQGLEGDEKMKTI